MLSLQKCYQKLKFFFFKNTFLTPELCRMLCSAPIHPHFDYACLAWYSKLSQKTKRKYKLCKTQIMQKKIQIMQNKFISFFLRLDKMQHISLTEFRMINWLAIKERVHQCINATKFKFVNNSCPFIWMKSLNSLRTVE